MTKNNFCIKEENLYAALDKWFESSPGCYLLDQEEEELRGLLEKLFGYHLVQIGTIGNASSHLEVSPIRTRVTIIRKRSQAATAGSQSHCLISRNSKLPVASDSVDVVIAPHTLDFTPEPHHVVREIDRILIPEGRVILCGFNPWGLWGLWRLFRLRSGRVPWCGQFLGAARVIDWLSLMGFELEIKRYRIYRPPVGRIGLQRKLDFLDRWGERFWTPFSGIYIIQAVKRVAPLTLRKSPWKLRSAGLGKQVVEPSTRSVNGG